MPITKVGNELGEVPFGELLSSIAQGIADGQRALDLTSIQTLVALSKTPVDVIPEVAEVITAASYDVPVSGQKPVQITGARVSANPADPVHMNALQAGLLPTFYQFTEANINLKLSIQLRQTEETDTEGKRRTRLMAFGSNVNFRTQNTFSYKVDASASVTATMRPIPPPIRLTPSTIVIDATGSQPVVTVNR